MHYETQNVYDIEYRPWAGKRFRSKLLASQNFLVSAVSEKEALISLEKWEERPFEIQGVRLVLTGAMFFPKEPEPTPAVEPDLLLGGED